MRYFKNLLAVSLLMACAAHGQPLESPFEINLSAPEIVDDPKLGTALLTLTTASNLDVPWEIAWGPDNWIWYTEQKGTISRVNPKPGERKLNGKEVWSRWRR